MVVVYTRTWCLLFFAGSQIAIAAEIEFWRMKGGIPYPEDNVVNYSDFESTEQYVVSVEVPESKYFAVFYWIGNKAPRTHAPAVARHAANLFRFRHHARMNIFREWEGKESCFFKNIFGNRQLVENFVTTALGRGSPDSSRMFLIGGFKDNFRYKEVKLALDSVLNISDHCIVFLAQNTFVYCGQAAVERQMEEAKIMAEVYLKKKGRKIDGVIFIRGGNAEDEEKLNKFFAELLVHTTRAKDEFIVGIPFERDYGIQENPPMTFSCSDSTIVDDEGWSNISTIVERVMKKKKKNKWDDEDDEYDTSSITSSRALLDSKHCYIVDTSSKFGLFVWLGKDCDVDQRLEAAGAAEIYSEKKRYSYETPITYVDERILPAGANRIDELKQVIEPNSYLKRLFLENPAFN